MGQQQAGVRGHVDDHRLHQDPADVLQVTQRGHGGAGGAQARRLATSAEGQEALGQHQSRCVALRRH